MFNTIKNMHFHYNKIIKSEKKVIITLSDSNLFTRISWLEEPFYQL